MNTTNESGTILKGQNIAIRFGQRCILNDVSLALYPGESVALIGPNGSGKTTLLRILAGLQKPQSGQIFLGDTTLDAMPRRQIAKYLSVIPQAKSHVFEFSAIELVLMGFYSQSARFSLPSAQQINLANNAMQTMAIQHLANQRVHTLSGGELQRVLMARTLVSHCPIWLLDEPTSNLDLKHQLALLNQVQKHCQSGGTALAILHDIQLVHRYFDRVIVLYQHHIIADGSPSDILTPPLIETTFGVSMNRHDLNPNNIVWTINDNCE